MKNFFTYFFLVVFVGTLAGCDDSVKNAVVETAKKLVTVPKDSLTLIRRTAVVDIIDGSGSGFSTYSVPHLTVDNIGSRIDGIRRKGEGDYWLTFVDMDARNNKVMHFPIPALPVRPKYPEVIGGEIRNKYEERLKIYQDSLPIYQQDSVKSMQAFQAKKTAFLTECIPFLEEGYKPKKKGTDFSDIIGSMNTALRSLATIADNGNTHKFIVLISDGVQDAPHLKPQSELVPIPDEVQIIQVSHSGTENNLVKGKAIEIDNLDRIAGFLFESK